MWDTAAYHGSYIGRSTAVGPRPGRRGGDPLRIRGPDHDKGALTMHRLLMLLLAGLLVLAACAEDAEEEVAETDDDAAEEEVDDDHDDHDDAADDDYDIAEQPDDAAAMFVSPSDGDTVTSPFEVELAAENITLAPAGDPVVGEGHLHVLADLGCTEDGEVIPGPSDDAEEEGYFHLGDGSDSREIELEPGTYELCVQLADGPHRAFGGTEVIEVTVE